MLKNVTEIIVYIFYLLVEIFYLLCKIFGENKFVESIRLIIKAQTFICRIEINTINKLKVSEEVSGGGETNRLMKYSEVDRSFPGAAAVKLRII